MEAGAVLVQGRGHGLDYLFKVGLSLKTGPSNGYMTIVRGTFGKSSSYVATGICDITFTEAKAR